MIGKKYHYETQKIINGKVEEYTKNILVEAMYSKDVVGFRDEGETIHSLVNVKYLKEGWSNDAKSR